MSRSSRARTAGAFIWMVFTGSIADTASPAFAQAAPGRADTVHLRFGWTAGTSARVETTRLSVRIAERADSVAGGAQYRMDAQAHAEGLLISYVDFVFPPPVDTTESARNNTLAEQAASIVPKFIVDSAGAFVRLDDVAEVKAKFDTLVTRMLPPDEAAATREGLETMLSEEALTGLAVQEWNAVVGMWADADLEMGEVYSFEEEAALPMIPGATVPMVSVFSIERRTSCVEGGTVEDCVEIRLVATPETEAMKAVLARFTERLLSTPGLGGIGFESLAVENEMVLITEPSTLKPHRVVLSKSVTGVVVADGQRSEVSQSDVRTYRYTY